MEKLSLIDMEKLSLIEMKKLAGGSLGDYPAPPPPPPMDL